MDKLYFKSLLVLIVVLSLFSFNLQASAQSTATVLINYTGGTCEFEGCYGVIDGGETYACVAQDGEPYGNWNDGDQTFLDPLPHGAILTHVSVELYAECNPGSTTYLLDGTLIDTVTGDFGPCDCTCPPAKIYSSEDYSSFGGFPNYNYGGTNTLNLSLSEEECQNCQICAYAARVTLTYTENQIPTVSPWGMALLAILLAISATWVIGRKKRAN